MSEHRARAQPDKLAHALLAALALVLGVWLRVSGHASVFAAGTVLALTPDATYHLHRSLGAFARFPSVPVFDPLMNWPYGAACHWSNGFDFVSAAFARVLAAQGDEHAAAAAIVFVPVWLGVACAVVTVVCARRLGAGRSDAALAVQLAWWLALLLPIGVYTSLLGRTDHHVAEALAVAALCAWLLRRFPGASFWALPAAQRWAFELEGAGLVAGSMYLFDGSLLYLAAAAAPLLWASATDDAPQVRARAAGSGAAAFAVGAAATLLLYAPNMRAHGQLLSYAFPSLLQPALLLGAALGLLAAHVIARRVARGNAALPLRRFGALLATGAALAVLALLSPLRAPLLAAISEHLLRGDPWLQQIEEFKPLLSWSTLLSRAGWQEAFKDFGVFAPATLGLLPLALLELRKTQPARAAVFAWLAAWLLGLSLLQERFTRPLWPLLALWTAFGIAALVQRAAAALRVRTSLALCAALAVVLGGVFGTTRLGSRLAAHQEPPRAGALASVFLAKANRVRADGTRAGVLTSWSLGHDMVWPAKSGVIANGFLFHVGREGLEQVQRALAGDEAHALALMQKRDLGWLVIGAEYYALARLGRERLSALVLDAGGRGVINLPFLQRAPLSISMLGGGGVPEASVPHLQTLVPRWAAPATLPNTAFALPVLWAFERVRGAVVQGAAPPGGRVTASVTLEVRGAALPYRAWTDADASGRFALRVPLWNGTLGDGVRAGARWSLRVPGQAPRELTLSEADVREGRTLTPP